MTKKLRLVGDPEREAIEQRMAKFRADMIALPLTEKLRLAADMIDDGRLRDVAMGLVRAALAELER